MSKTTDRVFLTLFGVYVAILVLATIGEVFDIDAILDLVDLKRVFAL